MGGFWNAGEVASYSFAALAGLVCFGVIVRAIFVPSDVRRRACCGGCGHEIVEPVPGRCPECGGALTKVGISTPVMAVRMRGGLGWALLAWTVLCGMVGQHIWDYVQQAAWMSGSPFAAPTTVTGSQEHAESRTFTPTISTVYENSDRDEAAMGFRIEYDSLFVEDGGMVESGRVTLMLRKTGKRKGVSLKVDLEKQSFELLDEKDKSLLTGKAEDIGDDVVVRWFESAGIEAKGKWIEASKRDALRLAKTAASDPAGVESLFSFGGSENGGLVSGGGGSSTAPAGGTGWGGTFTQGSVWTGWNIGLVSALGAGYVCGLGFIVWKRRRVVGGK